MRSVADKRFVALTAESVEGPIARDFVNYATALGMDSWSEEENDCDNFAAGFQQCAVAAYVNQIRALVLKYGESTRPKSGVLVGMAWFSRWRAGPHAIVQYVILAPGASGRVWNDLPFTERVPRLAEFWSVRHLEPYFKDSPTKMPYPVSLTQDELNSCTGYFYR